MKITFSLKFLFLTLLLFFIEVLIATIFKNIFFVRAYLGDVLVVMLLYCFVKTFFNGNNVKLIGGIFIFSCIVEFFQVIHIAEKLGFKEGSLMYIIIGNSFSWIDILCYFVGCFALYILNKYLKR